jgi:hypothetical protein
MAERRKAMGAVIQFPNPVREPRREGAARRSAATGVTIDLDMIGRIGALKAQQAALAECARPGAPATTIVLNSVTDQLTADQAAGRLWEILQECADLIAEYQEQWLSPAACRDARAKHVLRVLTAAEPGRRGRY